MFNKKEYIGISFDGELLRVAVVRPEKSGLRLLRLDTLTPVAPIERVQKAEQEVVAEGDSFEDDPFDMADDDPDSIFGLDDDLEEEDSGDLLDEIDLDEIDEDVFADDAGEPDLVDESSEPESNEMLLFEYFESLGSKKQMALNIPAGDTIFQIITDRNYKETKKKDLIELIEEKLHSIYGGMPDKNYYDYIVREDGTLIIGSLDQESPTLQLVNNTRAAYGKNYFINDVVSDESVMVGLYRSHYDIEIDGFITGLLQIGPNKCRMIFMRDGEIMQISPIINEGTNHKAYLNTIFSKLLFLLDTGEIPGLDRLILFNNSQGDKALDFFRSSFSELVVENFSLNSDKVIVDEGVEKNPDNFSTTIGLASVAAKYDSKLYPKLSFLPDYVADQQKIFKLQWHGFLLLFLIGASPVYLNHQYQQNQFEIESLQSQSDRLETSITDLRPTVQQVEDLTERLTNMQNQLELLTDLSTDNIKWTVTLDLFNRAVNETGGIWINSFRQNNDVLMVDGYATQQHRIPELAGKFSTVTLLNVRKDEIRGRDIFFFTMMIREITGDKSLYTPRIAREFLETNNP